MSHERADGKITFFCDGCDEHMLYESVDFVLCAGDLRVERRWTTTKQIGAPWCDWCPKCIGVAKEEQRKFEERERERERLKARNARE